MAHEDSCEELMERIYEKIARSKLNAFITLCKDAAIEKARAYDKNKVKGKLAGVPIAIKDSISTKGIRTTCASRILEDYVPPYDAHVMELLKKEGAIIIGKANMDEFSMGTTTETSYFGPTLNPYDQNRVAGGSSGGSAAAVAELGVLALGGDTGGSIRCPASFCGVVGLKPTYGLISRYGLIAYANSLEQIGPMASSVQDIAILLDVISGKDNRDSTQIGSKGGYSSSPDSDISGMKIGVPNEFLNGIDPESEVGNHVMDALRAFEERGCTPGEVEIPHMKYAIAAYYTIAMSEASSNLARFDGLRYGLRGGEDKDLHTTFSEIRARGFGPEVKRRILLGTYALSAGYYGRYYLKALRVRTLLKRDFERALKRFDVLIAPTMPFVAFKLGERKDPLSLYLADINTVPVNLAGLPAISIPCGFSNSGSKKGLPVGLQIIGSYFDEKKILMIAFAFETFYKSFTKTSSRRLDEGCNPSCRGG